MAFQEALVLNDEIFLMNVCAIENLRCHHLETSLDDTDNWWCCLVPGGPGITSRCVGINNYPSTKLKPNFYFPFQNANLLIR